MSPNNQLYLLWQHWCTAGVGQEPVKWMYDWMAGERVCEKGQALIKPKQNINLIDNATEH